MPENPTLLLVDNGSIKPAATLQLRKIAVKLGELTNQKIHPVSLQHADVVLAEFLREQLEQGKRDFIILPLFFGKSRALTKFIPDVQAELEEAFGEFKLKIADTLFPFPQTDARLADIIFDNIQTVAQAFSNSKHSSAEQERDTPPLLHSRAKVGGCTSLNNIVLVDHGSPSPQITAVRNAVAEEIQTKLGQETKLEQAVMERREGKQYDFNGELLEDYLNKKAQQGEAIAIVALLFSLPGRHAGEGGDIEKICQSVMQRYPQFKIAITPLVGEHPLLLEILADRLNA